jgi:pimeloyl-ACP methyl ester carboxylesterase
MTDSAQPFAAKKFLEIKGRRMAYIDEGEGAPIVFAHGNPTSSYRIVRAMLPNALDRHAVLVGADGAETTRTVQQFLSGITNHVAHHLAFVYEKRRALGLAAPQAL